MKQLGFGCVRLTCHLTYAKAIANLQAAFDSGVTHYDVARLYGFGTAEKILGQFIKDKRDKVSITSKFGIYPGNPVMGNLYVRKFSRFAFRMLKKMPARKVAQGAANEIILHKNFSVTNAQKSLETSLLALQTDYIDYYLLHEPTVMEACNPAIIDFLEKQKQKGTIGEYGLGSFVNKIEDPTSDLPRGYSVLQSDYSLPYDFPLAKDWANEKHLFFFSHFRYYQTCKQMLANDEELATIEKIAQKDVAAFDVQFQFLVFGKSLRGNNTTPRPVLFQNALCSIYYDNVHTQRLKVNGKNGQYRNKINHDDRKPLSRWLSNQAGYSLKEAICLRAHQTTRFLPFQESGKRKYSLLSSCFFIVYWCRD